MKKRIEWFLELMIPLLIGVVFRSLYLLNNNDWKIILPILLTCMGIQRIFDKYNK